MENVERPYPSNGNQNDNFLSSIDFHLKGCGWW